MREEIKFWIYFEDGFKMLAHSRIRGGREKGVHISGIVLVRKNSVTQQDENHC